MEILSVNFKHLLDLTRSSCEKYNYRQETNLHVKSNKCIKFALEMSIYKTFQHFTNAIFSCFSTPSWQKVNSHYVSQLTRV
jgi:hypothetical protein